MIVLGLLVISVGISLEESIMGDTIKCVLCFVIVDVPKHKEKHGFLRKRIQAQAIPNEIYYNLRKSASKLDAYGPRNRCKDYEQQQQIKTHNKPGTKENLRAHHKQKQLRCCVYTFLLLLFKSLKKLIGCNRVDRSRVSEMVGS